MLKRGFSKSKDNWLTNNFIYLKNYFRKLTHGLIQRNQ